MSQPSGRMHIREISLHRCHIKKQSLILLLILVYWRSCIVLISVGKQVFFCVQLTDNIKATPLRLTLISRWPCQPPGGQPPTLLCIPLLYSFSSAYILSLHLLTYPSISFCYIPPCPDLIFSPFFSFCVSVLWNCHQWWEKDDKKGESDFLLTARRERTRASKGKALE